MNDQKRSPRGPQAPAARMRGVTLMELMITVVIVGLLAAIAYPSYTNQIQKTRRADGQGALLTAAQGLERCFTRFHDYTHDDCDIHDEIDGGMASPEGWYVVDFSGVPSADSFVLEATPQNAQTADARCGSLGLDNLGQRTATGTLPDAECW